MTIQTHWYLKAVHYRMRKKEKRRLDNDGQDNEVNPNGVNEGL